MSHDARSPSYGARRRLSLSSETARALCRLCFGQRLILCRDTAPMIQQLLGGRSTVSCDTSLEPSPTRLSPSRRQSGPTAVAGSALRVVDEDGRGLVVGIESNDWPVDEVGDAVVVGVCLGGEPPFVVEGGGALFAAEAGFVVCQDVD